LVYPTSLKASGIGLFAGVPFIFGANMFRLLIMAWIDKLKPAYSTFFHNYLWQVAFIIMVAFMWIVWIEKVVNRETKAPVSC
jgi:exosortase/archaeosortase family protein